MSGSKFAVVFAVALAGVTPSAWTATIPYTNDFSGSGGNVDFPHENVGTGQSWEVTGGEYRLRGTSTASNQIVASAVVQITNAAGYSSITVESKFRLPTNPVTPNGANFTGLAAFGLTSALEGSSASNAYYLADWQFGSNNSSGVGQVRILSLGDTSGFNATNGLADAFTGAGGDNWAAQPNTVYTLRLTATLNSGTLNMSFGVFDAAGTTQIGTSATASDTSPLTGQYFGLRSRIGSGNQPQDLFFDDFKVTGVPIPEPTTIALLGMSAALALRRRCRN